MGGRGEGGVGHQGGVCWHRRRGAGSEAEVEYSVALAEAATVKAEVEYPTAMAKIFSQERRFLVDRDGVDEADDCADAEAAGEGGGQRRRPAPVLRHDRHGRVHTPLLGERFRQSLDAGHALGDARRQQGDAGGSPDAQASVCALPSGSTGPSPPTPVVLQLPI